MTPTKPVSAPSVADVSSFISPHVQLDIDDFLPLISGK